MGLLVRRGLMQQVDDGIFHPNGRTIGEKKRVQRRARQCAEEAVDDPLHGLREVGGQGDRSVMVQLTRMGSLRNRHNTGGLPQDKHCVQAEVQVEHVLDHLTVLVRTLPEQHCEVAFPAQASTFCCCSFLFSKLF